MAHEEHESIWATALVVNSLLWSIAAAFFIYTVGVSILLWNAKPFVIGFIIAGILTFSEVVVGILSE